MILKEKQVEKLRNEIFRSILPSFTGKHFSDMQRGTTGQQAVVRKALDFADLAAREALLYTGRKREEEMKQHASKQEFKKRRAAFVDDLRKGKHEADDFPLG